MPKLNPEGLDTYYSALRRPAVGNRVTGGDRTTSSGVDYEEWSQQQGDYYKSLQVPDTIRRTDLLPSRRATDTPVQDIVNFMVGDELAGAGFKLDQYGIHWGMDTMVDAWSEHPWRTGIAYASWAAPILGSFYKAQRVAKYTALGAPEMLNMGMITSIDDWAKLSDKSKKVMQMNLYDIQRHKELTDRVQDGTATLRDRFLYGFKKRFGNSWMELADPDSPMSVRLGRYDTMITAIKDREIVNLVSKMPEPVVRGEYGFEIARSLFSPQELRRLPAEVKPWAEALKGTFRKGQRARLESGFISPEEFAHIGEVHVPMQRIGTPVEHAGPMLTVFQRRGGKIVGQSIPKTGAQSLLRREATQKEAFDVLRRSDAWHKLNNGDPEAAVAALGNSNKDIAALIRAGDHPSALDKLSEAGVVEMTGEKLTLRGLVGDEVLHNTFLYVRDIAMNPRITKTASEIEKLGPGAQKKWVHLGDTEKFPGASRIRRMIAKKKGIPESQVELGWVHEDVFKELGHVKKVGSTVPGWLEFATAMHKIAKTAGNPFTHGQNVSGNVVFGAMRGFNIFETGNWDIMKQSWGAIAKAQKFTRSGVPTASMKPGELGVVKSLVGGKDIDIAEELSKPLVHELIEAQSLMASEGVGALQAISARTDPTTFLNKAVSYTQRMSKKGGVLSLQRWADNYMAEDGVFKLGQYLRLKSEGFSDMAAALEVGKTFPMYSAIGTIPASLRKVVLPWISFPAEALRIMKNNIVDYPLRSAVFLHAVDATQAMLSLATGQSYQEIQDVKGGLPTWAQKSTALVTPFRDNNDDIRAAVIDSLPWSSFLPPTEATDVSFFEKLPLGLDEPFPILKGLYDAVSGKGAYGEDIPTDPTTVSDDIKRSVLNTMSFLAPPWLGKYVLNSSTPTPTYRFWQDVGRYVNPSTEKPGSVLFDAFLNNIVGVGKMWPSSPEQEAFNEDMRLRGLEGFRGRLARDWYAAIKNENWRRAGELATDVMDTFTQEYGDPYTATQKMGDWMKRRATGLRRHPRLRGWSKDQIQQMIDKNLDSAGKARSEATAKYVRLLREELLRRRTAGNASGLINIYSGSPSGGAGLFTGRTGATGGLRGVYGGT